MLALILLLSVNCAFAQFEYIDQHGREALYAAAAAYTTNDPTSCLKQAFPLKNYRIVSNEESVCDKESLCRIYTAVSNVDKSIIVAFRGPMNGQNLKLNILEDLRPTHDFYGFGLVEDYFLDALDALWRPVNATLSQLSTRQYRVTFIGHSTGGAIAALAALRTSHFVLRPSEQISVYTFGEPRVGNRNFAVNFDRAVPNTWRVVHKADDVPHLTRCSSGGKNGEECNATDPNSPFHHATEVWYNNDMGEGTSFTLCTKSSEDVICSDKLKKFDNRDHYNYFQRNIQDFGQDGCLLRKTTSTISTIAILAFVTSYLL